MEVRGTGRLLEMVKAMLYVGREPMYEVYRGGHLALQNLVRGRTFLFRPLQDRTLSSKMRTQAMETRVTHPLVRKVPT
jgi:hypothetical protein